MSGRVTFATFVGIAIFVVITFFEQIPVVGWLGALVSIGAWIWLGGEIRRAGGTLIDAGIAGAVTGLVGAVTAWLLQVGNLFGPETPGLARFGAGLGTIGATIFLFLWPVIGACICGGAAALRARRSMSRA
ncbi:MAG TPA: hypothetical protein VKR80_01540 [Candidatus Limnocylindria bacterium]|nr:hypothetical protein [Candidatus Limnocylindria bacterium]